MKYHVGSNVPGYLPECDIYCAESIESAVEVLRGDLKDQQDYYYEQCEEGLPESCECHWCDVAGYMEGVLGSVAEFDSAVGYSVKVAGRYDSVLRPQQGPDLVFWITGVRGCDCEEEV